MAADAMQCHARRNLAVKKLSPEEERQQLLSNAQPAADVRGDARAGPSAGR